MPSASVTRLAALLLVLVAAPAALAQSAVVGGTVTDADSGEPLPGANVTLAPTDTTLGDGEGRAATAEGAFLFPSIAPGRYVLRASSAGYEPALDTLDLAAGDRVERLIALRPDRLGRVVVEAGAAEAIQAGRIQIQAADIASLPGPDPAGDLLQALTFQPGVVALGDRGGQLTVRGGTPVQNLVLVDGVPLFQPFHIVGFYSAIPADVVGVADVWAGGYPARHGGRIASVVDVTTRNGSKRRVGGSMTLAPFLAALRLEGPIVPGDVSVLVSIRESAIERFGDVLGRDFPFQFSDALGKVHAQLNPTTFLTGTVLRTSDVGDLTAASGGTARVGWENEGAAGRFFSISPAFAAAIDVGAFTSVYRSTFEPEVGAPRESETRTFGGHFGYAYYLGPHTVRAGIGGQTFLFDYTFDTNAPPVGENTTETHLFLDADLDLGRGVMVEPGLRVQAFPSQVRTTSVEPRGRVTWAYSETASVSAAAGLYRQEIVGLTDQLDVGEGFIAWAPTLDGRPIPRAVHLLAGWQGQPTRSLRLSAEGYAKSLYNQVLLLTGRGRVLVDGSAVGVDVTAAWRRGPLSLDLVYGLSETTYTDTFRGGGGLPGEPRAPVDYNPPHDRRHRVRAVLRYARGPWALGARAELASGRPYSQVVGAYRELDPGEGYETDPGDTTIILSETPYQALTPAYARLDLSAERRFPLGPAGLVVHGSLVNATNRANVYTFDLFRGERVDQFRIIPSVGLRLELE